jgi:hypothetical protein
VNLCSKPGCARAGAAVLAYDYEARAARLQDPVPGELSPHVYVLCSGCAARLRPPRGWELEDARSTPPLFVDGAEPPSLTVVIDTDAGKEREPEVAGRQLFFGYSA